MLYDYFGDLTTFSVFRWIGTRILKNVECMKKSDAAILVTINNKDGIIVGSKWGF